MLQEGDEEQDSTPATVKTRLGNRLFRIAAGSFGFRIFYSGLAFINGILLARLLGKSGLGTYAYAIESLNMFSIPATLGINSLLIREVAIYQSMSDWGLINGILSWANKIVFFVSLGLALGAVCFVWSLGIFAEPQMLTAFCIAMVFLPICALRNLRLDAMKGLQQVLMGLWPDLVLSPLLLIIFTGCAYLFLKEKLQPSWVVGMYGLTITITFLIGAKLLNRYLPNAVKKATPKYQAQLWIRSALPFMFLGSMYVISSRSDLLMLGVIKGSDAVGIYVPINRGAELINFVLIAVDNSLSPIIASLYSQNKIEQLQQVVTDSSRLLMLVCLPLAFVMIVFGHHYLLIFGPDFTKGQTALTILCIGQIVNAATGPVGLLISMTGHARFGAITDGIIGLLNIILNLLLIPQWGVEGTAIATATSIIIVNVVRVIWVRKKIGIDSTCLGRHYFVG